MRGQLLQKIKAGNQVLSGDADRIVADKIVAFDNACSGNFFLGLLIFGQLLSFKEERAGVEPQLRVTGLLGYLRKLICLFGQTAQLVGFSTAGFGFTMHVV